METAYRGLADLYILAIYTSHFLSCLCSCKYLCLIFRYWEGAAVCIMLEDIDLICEILRILMEACTDNGKAITVLLMMVKKPT